MTKHTKLRNASVSNVSEFTMDVSHNHPTLIA